MTTPADTLTVAATSGRFAASTSGALPFADPAADASTGKDLAPRCAVSDPVADPVVLLYADFPGLGDRWETDTDRTAEIVERAHLAFRQTVAALGGALVPAPVDARCARFGSVAAAAVAGMTYRRAIQSRGELPVRLAIAATAVSLDDGIPMATFNRARLLAEGAHVGECVLDRAAAECVTAELPDGVRLRPTLRSLRDLQQCERAMLLEDAAASVSASLKEALPIAHVLRRRGVGLSARLRGRARHG